MIQLEIPLFDHLQDAIAAPEEAQLAELLRLFDSAMTGLDDRTCLEVAGTALVQLATVFEAKYLGWQREVAQVKSQVNGIRTEPVVSEDFFDRFVRQSMVVNFDPFIEPMALLPLPGMALDDIEMTNDIAVDDAAVVQEVLDSMIDDAAVLLEALPDRNPTPVDQITALAHGEEIERWTEELTTIVEKLQQRKRKSISLLDLVCSIEAARTQASRKDCLIETWLAWLLGDHPYHLHRTAHDFYSVVGIQVVAKN